MGDLQHKDAVRTGRLITEMQEFGMDKTPDGAKWTEADYDEMTECINEL